MQFSLFTSSDIGRASNIIYPKRVVVTDADSMKVAASFDHVGALYKDNKRSNDTFLESDCLMLDFDNTHSEKEGDWVTPFDVAMEFPGISFIAVFSRNHMKEKNGAAARPKFHAYFPVPKFVDVKAYSEFKKKFYQAYPFFDSNALDGARFFFGVENPQVEVYEGDSTILEILEEDDFAKWEESLEQIGEGSRNTTMSHVAGKLIKRYGDTQSAYELFLKTATKCNPPLPDEELERIWNSAKRFGNKVSKQDGYIPPEQYNSGCVLRPEDFSDVGQATVLAQEYMDKLRYSPSTDYMVYKERIIGGRKEMGETKYFLMEVDKLIPYARNARTHSEVQIVQIAASIKEFGFLSPVIISKDNTILCGHGRYYAAQKLGLEKIPCIQEEYLTEAQKKAYILADNKISQNAGWDEELLKVEIADLQGADFDVSLTGFEDYEITDLFAVHEEHHREEKQVENKEYDEEEFGDEEFEHECPRCGFKYN